MKGTYERFKNDKKGFDIRCIFERPFQDLLLFQFLLQCSRNTRILGTDFSVLGDNKYQYSVHKYL
jgi:hypothetical protein